MNRRFFQGERERERARRKEKVRKQEARKEELITKALIQSWRWIEDH
jgi:hypothetical protein